MSCTAVHYIMPRRHNLLLKTLESKIIRNINNDPQISAEMKAAELASSALDVLRKPAVRALHRDLLEHHHYANSGTSKAD